MLSSFWSQHANEAAILELTYAEHARDAVIISRLPEALGFHLRDVKRCVPLLQQQPELTCQAAGLSK